MKYAKAFRDALYDFKFEKDTLVWKGIPYSNNDQLFILAMRYNQLSRGVKALIDEVERLEEIIKKNKKDA